MAVKTFSFLLLVKSLLFFVGDGDGVVGTGGGRDGGDGPVVGGDRAVGGEGDDGVAAAVVGEGEGTILIHGGVGVGDDIGILG